MFMNKQKLIQGDSQEELLRITGIACKNQGRDFIGIEREEEYIEIAKKRIDNV